VPNASTSQEKFESVPNESTSQEKFESVPNEGTLQIISVITSVLDESTMDQELMVHVESTSPRIAVPNESTHGIRSLDRSVRKEGAGQRATCINAQREHDGNKIR
jgi:hypothetical protein